MQFPGFTADASAVATIRSYHMVQTKPDSTIQPAARMTPQECYKRDSNCTKFCGQVKDPDWRHECFMRCNKYLDNCLGRGVWTDRAATRFSI
jgi:hypothetical protein